MKKVILFLIIFSIGGYCQQNNLFIFNQEKFELREKSFSAVQDPFRFQFQENEKQQKSVGKAFFLSLLIPGMGEYYLNKPAYTKIFLSLEGLIWGGMLSNNLRIKWMEKEYKTYARQHAGVSSGSKDDRFWLKIGKFDDIYEHNEERRRDRIIDEIYEENAINFWRWDSRSNRLNYDSMRIDARQLENFGVYFYTSLVLNHFVSAINSLRLAKKHNRNINQGEWNIGLNHNIKNKNISVSLVKIF